ncbi:uncharacterized protein [Sinocyclocheilus grahami]|uniref:uncharacterized protein n=1 Tax=Sinocyclocheilus grahami TaxID=75366 RepID=UPI0007AC5A50|nr:PREDICTED: uncharacterized protein LOC107596279 [Sinocyclocheilus grahami]
MATPSQNLDLTAKVSPVDDARSSCPNDMRNVRGLPADGLSGLKKRAQIRIATLNVGTMTGRSRELAEALKNCRIDIAWLQETKWKGAKTKEIGERYKLYYGTSSNRNGIGIVVSEKQWDNVTEIHRISDRLMAIKIKSGAMTLRIVSGYAPQTGCPDNAKDIFWESLDAHLRTVGPDEYIAIGGDLNGHVGSARGGYDAFHGGSGYGDCILECAETHGMAVVNTFFRKRPSHLMTCANGGRATQIDYMLIRRRDLKLVKKQALKVWFQSRTDGDLQRCKTFKSAAK